MKVLQAPPAIALEAGETRRRLLQRLRGAASRTEVNAIRPRAGSAAGVLSYAQERLWFLDQLGLVGAAYSVPALLELAGEVRLAALGQALGEVVRRHEVLRTRFV